MCKAEDCRIDCESHKFIVIGKETFGKFLPSTNPTGRESLKV